LCNVQVDEMLMLVLAGWCCVQYESIFWWWWWQWCWCGFTTAGFLCSDGCLCSEAGKVLHRVLVVQAYWFDFVKVVWMYFALAVLIVS